MKLRNIAWVIVGILVILFAWRIVARLTAGRAEQTEKVIPVVAVKATPGSLSARVSLTGDIKGAAEVLVKPSLPGRVMEIYVNEGDWVKEGAGLLSYVASIEPDNELYNDMVVFAPISGLVGVKYVNLGDQTSTSNPVFSIYQIDRVNVYCDLPEKYYSLVHPGTSAQITLDALPNRIFHGTVGSVRPVIDPLSRTSRVEIILPNPGRQIKPGMFARVDLLLEQKNGVLTIPFDAVLGEDQKSVYVIEGGAAVQKNITLGLLSGLTVEVTSGLVSGDQVIVVGQRVVKAGSKVEVKAE